MSQQTMHSNFVCDAIGMAEVPKSLVAEIKALEEQLTISPTKLKAITDHFVKELEKGMSCPNFQPLPWEILY